jgi:DNA polymerase kappa
LRLQLDGFINMTSAESTEESAHLEENQDDALKTLKYHLLGPSLTKAGQDQVDQSKVSNQKS